MCIYYILYCAVQSYRASRVAGWKTPTWASSWAPSWTCTAKLGCPGALGRQVRLPRGSWAPSWTAKAHLNAILSSNLASKCLSRAPPTPQNHAPVQTRTQIQ